MLVKSLTHCHTQSRFILSQILVAGGKSNSAISAKIVQEQQYLKKANLSDKECEKNVGEVICKMTPACSKDSTKVIAFLRKQKCLEMVTW